MAASKAKIKANAKYTAKAYEKYLVYFQKGQKRIVQAHAAEAGESMNGFINRAIAEAMERDNEKGTR